MVEHLRDWHRADIKAALEKANTNYSKLAAEHGIASATLRNALRAPYPKCERIIAERIGMTPEEVWPSRYAKKSAKAAK